MTGTDRTPGLMTSGPDPPPISGVDVLEIGGGHLSSAHDATCQTSNEDSSPLFITSELSTPISDHWAALLCLLQVGGMKGKGMGHLSLLKLCFILFFTHSPFKV